MKAEFTFPPEFVSAVAQEVAAALKPLLAAREKEPHVDNLMGMTELAKHLGGVSKDWIYQRTANNEIPFVKIGHLIKFRRSDRSLRNDSSRG